MRVKSLVDHINDYPFEEDRPTAFAAREKRKGQVYVIPDDREAQILIDDGTVEEVKKAKS